jgi:hypothetical protein
MLAPLPACTVGGDEPNANRPIRQSRYGTSARSLPLAFSFFPAPCALSTWIDAPCDGAKTHPDGLAGLLNRQAPPSAQRLPDLPARCRVGPLDDEGARSFGGQTDPKTGAAFVDSRRSFCPGANVNLDNDLSVRRGMEQTCWLRTSCGPSVWVRMTVLGEIARL